MSILIKVISINLVPTPNITIFKAAKIYAGTKAPLILTCNVTIDSAFADFTNVSITWFRGTVSLINGTDRVTISPLSKSGSLFTSILTLTPPTMEDNATFTCTASATPSTELASVNASDVGEESIDVTVQGRLTLLNRHQFVEHCFCLSATAPPPPSVNISRSSDLVTAGELFNISCLVMIPHELMSGPILKWSGPGVNQNNNRTSGEPPHILIFNRVYTSHAGVYTCVASFNIPEAGINFTGMGMIVVGIQSMCMIP